MATSGLSSSKSEAGSQQSYYLPASIIKPESIKRVPNEVFCQILDILFSNNAIVCRCDVVESASHHKSPQSYAILLSCAYIYSVGLPLYYSNCTLDTTAKALDYDHFPKPLVQLVGGLDLSDVRTDVPNLVRSDSGLLSFSSLKRLRLPYDIITGDYDHYPSDNEILAARGFQDQVVGRNTVGLIAGQFPEVTIRWEKRFAIITHNGNRRVYGDLYTEIEVRGVDMTIKSKRIVSVWRRWFMFGYIALQQALATRMDA